jgi:hypothetical protein
MVAVHLTHGSTVQTRCPGWDVPRENGATFGEETLTGAQRFFINFIHDQWFTTSISVTFGQTVIALRIFGAVRIAPFAMGASHPGPLFGISLTSSPPGYSNGLYDIKYKI